MKVIIICERPSYYRKDFFNILTGYFGKNILLLFVSNQKNPIRDVICTYKDEPFLEQAHFIRNGPIIYRNMSALYQVYRFNPDVIVNVGLPLRTMFLMAFAKLFGKSIVTWWAGTKESETEKTRLHVIYRKFLIRFLDGAINYSLSSEEYLKHLVPFLKKSIVIGNNTLDSKYFNMKIKTEMFNIYKGNVIKILSVGFLIKRKNIMTLLKVFHNLSKTIDFIELVIVGDGPEYEELKNYIDKNHLSSVKIKGFIEPSEIHKDYASADIFVQPSAVDQWPQTFNEAASAGLPILISSTSGVCNRYTEQFSSEAVFDPEDKCRLEDLLFRLIKSEKLRKNLGIKAFECALENDCNVVADKFISYISSF